MNGMSQATYKNGETPRVRNYIFAALFSLLSLPLVIAGCNDPANKSIPNDNDKPVATTYTVSFGIDDATGTAPAPKIVPKGETLELPALDNLAKPSLTAVGWKDGNKTYAAGTSFKPTANIKLTADWRGSFVSEWKTTEAHQEISLPVVPNGTYDFTVDWGDDTDEPETFTTHLARHIYENAGDYRISITGQIKGWSFNEDPTSKKAIQNIQSWGSLDFGKTSGQFAGCTNMQITATDAPVLSSTESLARAFRNASSLTTIPGAAKWDVSNVTNMRAML